MLTHSSGRVASFALALALTLGTGCMSPQPVPVNDPIKRALAHYDLGVHYLSQGRIALAIRELRTADEANPQDPWIAAALAQAYIRRDKPDEAEAQYLRALELDPELHSARLNLSALYLLLERYADAIPHLGQLADDATFGAPWRALTNLGWAQYRLGQLGQARGSLEMAIDYRPGYWPALLNLGILEHKEGHALEALRLFERVTEARARPEALAEANYRVAEIDGTDEVTIGPGRSRETVGAGEEGAR